MALCPVCNGTEHNPAEHDSELSGEEVQALRKIVCKLGYLLTAQNPLQASRIQSDIAVEFDALPGLSRPAFQGLTTNG